MQIQPIDLTELVATILGISIVLVPVIGITARIALKPTVEALSRLFENRNTSETMEILERRIEFQEQQLDAIQHTLRGLSDAQDFHRSLSAPQQDDAAARTPE